MPIGQILGVLEKWQQMPTGLNESVLKFTLRHQHSDCLEVGRDALAHVLLLSRDNEKPVSPRNGHRVVFDDQESSVGA